jgi:4-amino-4-deoxy-L-arabinose transferase-like glycosyltransferase
MKPSPAFGTFARTTVVAAFVLLAGALLMLYWFPEGKLLAGDERSHYQPLALSILAGGDWFDPLMLWPPLQGLLMAAVYALTGPNILAMQIVQLAMLVAAGFLLRRIWFALTGDATAAAWAGVLLVVNPLTVGFATYLWPEILHLLLSLAMTWLLIGAVRGTEARARVASAAGAGALLGLCLLTKSLLTAFWPFLVLPLLMRGAWGERGLRATAFVLAALLITAPALFRGWQETGRPQIADSSWFNLWAGLSDTYRGDLVRDMTGTRMAEYLASSDDHAGRVAFARAKVAAIVESKGLFATVGDQLGKQYFRLFDARNFVAAQLHGPECRGYIAHYTADSPDLNRTVDYVVQIWHVGLLVLLALGLAAWRRWREPWVWLIGAFVGYQLALFAGLHVKSRFLLPMVPVFCVMAAHFISLLPTFRASSSPLSPVRRGIGIALAMLLAFLALAGPALDRACT